VEAEARWWRVARRGCAKALTRPLSGRAAPKAIGFTGFDGSVWQRRAGELERLWMRTDRQAGPLGTSGPSRPAPDPSPTGAAGQGLPAGRVATASGPRPMAPRLGHLGVSARAVLPGPGVTGGVQVRVTLTAIDWASDIVAFVGPRGIERVVAVRDPAMRELFRQPHLATRVDLTYVETVTVSVEPSAN
jgi:hypothetical protein